MNLTRAQRFASAPQRLLDRAAALTLVLLVALAGGCGDGRRVSTADQLFIDARDLLAAGETDKALANLNESIDLKPSVWCFVERAKILAQRGEDAAALKDCDAALEMAPEDSNVVWLKGEIKKPLAQRFQGRFKDPPSRLK